MRDYLTELLRELPAQSQQHEYVVFTPKWADPIGGKHHKVEVVRLSGVPRSKILRALYQQLVLPIAARLARVDVFLATATVAPLAMKAPVVLCVQFLQFYDMPEAYGRLRSAYLRMFVPLSVRKATHTIVFTRAAAQDLVRHTGVSEDRVRVVPHGISAALGTIGCANDFYDPRNHYTGRRPYVVYVSATYGYKNHNRLIKAFARAKNIGNCSHVLLLVGAEAGISFKDLRRQALLAGVSDSVVIAGRVEDVTPFYRFADLAVMPSLCETFGFPVLEAMAFGCPVVASDRGSVAELAGDAALLVDATDVSALARGIVQGLTDRTLRTRLAAQGPERAAAFTWSATAAGTLRVLEEAIASVSKTNASSGRPS